MDEPTFREGLIFESKTVLKAAITQHSVKHNRAIKYKKDDAIRLRAMCHETCSSVLYATKEGKKPSFVIKTYRGEHTCPMVYTNRRVSSTYLAEKYEPDWRAEPNMSMSAFINKVKRDNLGDISVWTAYRTKAILTMLEDIRVYLMKRIVACREACEKWSADVGPRILKILEKKKALAMYEWADYSGKLKFQVWHNASNPLNAVGIGARTCSCRSWQLSGIPCCHAIASLTSRGMNVIEYVDDMYKKAAYLRTYSPSISHVTSPDSWPNPGICPLSPPFFSKRLRRPKKNRRREPNKELPSSQSKMAKKSQTPTSTTTPPSSDRQGRAGLIMRCTKCGETGHNRRSCKGAPPPPATGS